MTLPVPSQRTWSVGDIVTAAMMNANVRDAVNFLAAPPLFVGLQATVQSLATATWTPLNFDSTVVDTYSGHSNTVNNSRYTCQVAGWYAMSGVLTIGTTTNTHRGEFLKNGVAINGSQYAPISSASAIVTDLAYPTTVAQCAVGDYLQIAAFQDSGASVGTLVSAPRQPCFTVWWAHS